MANKVTYLLKKFPNTEWSGPAWFSFKLDQKGWPVFIKLEHFVPLDLGHGTRTEWDGDDFCKLYPTILNKYPKIGKCIQGNIHSHHSMGAYFSGTDDELLIQNVNNAFYPSLVVASSGKALWAFAYSYKDQFDLTHLHEIEEKDIEVKYPKNSIPQEWKDELKPLKKASKVVTYHSGLQNNQNQGYMFGNYGNTLREKKENKELKTYDEIMEEYNHWDGAQSVKAIEDELEKNGMDINGRPLNVK